MKKIIPILLFLFITIAEIRSGTNWNNRIFNFGQTGVYYITANIVANGTTINSPPLPGPAVSTITKAQTRIAELKARLGR